MCNVYDNDQGKHEKMGKTNSSLHKRSAQM